MRFRDHFNWNSINEKCTRTWKQHKKTNVSHKCGEKSQNSFNLNTSQTIVFALYVNSLLFSSSVLHHNVLSMILDLFVRRIKSTYKYCTNHMHNLLLLNRKMYAIIRIWKRLLSFVCTYRSMWTTKQKCPLQPQCLVLGIQSNCKERFGDNFRYAKHLHCPFYEFSHNLWSGLLWMPFFFCLVWRRILTPGLGNLKVRLMCSYVSTRKSNHFLLLASLEIDYQE